MQSLLRGINRCIPSGMRSFDVSIVLKCETMFIISSIRYTSTFTSRASSQHYNDVIMSAMASQIISLTIVYCLFRRRSEKTSKLRVTGLCAGNSPMSGYFSAQMASNEENVSIWWRHHDDTTDQLVYHRSTTYIIHSMYFYITCRLSFFQLTAWITAINYWTRKAAKERSLSVRI